MKDLIYYAGGAFLAANTIFACAYIVIIYIYNNKKNKYISELYYRGYKEEFIEEEISVNFSKSKKIGNTPEVYCGINAFVFLGAALDAGAEHKYIVFIVIIVIFCCFLYAGHQLLKTNYK